MLHLNNRIMYWNDLCIIQMKSIIEKDGTIIITKPDLTKVNIIITELFSDVLSTLRGYIDQYAENPNSFEIGQ